MWPAGFISRHRYLMLQWLVPLLLVVVWQLSAQFDLIPRRILPAPFDVLRAASRLTASGEMALHIRISTFRAGTGFLIGGSIGLMLGILTGTFSVAEILFDSTLQMIRNIPHLALLPLIILWFGIDEKAKIVLVALGVFFPVYLNTYHGVRSADPHLLEMGRVYGIGRFALFRHVVMPGALPSILIGIRYALGIMWLTLIVAETIAATSGIGYLAMNAREFMQTEVIVLAILLYAFLGKLSDTITRLLERRLLRWRAV
jgi:sulfonate transport system permease protein